MKEAPGEKSEAPFIRVPKSILKRTDISQTGKLLYGLVMCLSDGVGYCYASDAYLGEQIGVSTRQANRTITELETLRVVLVTGATSRRHIRPAYDKNGVSCIEIETPLTTKMAQGLTTDLSTAYDKNVHIIDNNKKENKKEILPSAFQEQKEPLDALPQLQYGQLESAARSSLIARCRPGNPTLKPLIEGRGKAQVRIEMRQMLDAGWQYQEGKPND